MPRKPKVEKKTITVVLDGRPITVILHPPTAARKSWYAYWNGLVTSKSTGHSKLEDAITAAEHMLKNGGERAVMADMLISDEEFEEVQRTHYGKKKGDAAQARAAKSLQSCLEAIDAFKRISGLTPITIATPDDCESFQNKASALPKNTLRPYPKGKRQVPCYSANTVLKWSVALKAAWERVCRTGGKKCVRGVIDERKFLAENPWRQFTWIEGYERPIRQFDGDELLGLLAYFDKKWPGVTTAPLLAKVLLWSCGRRAEIVSLTWPQLRAVGDERHFEIIGKWGIRKWFRIPEGLFQQLLAIRVQSPYVFAAHNNQLRRFHERGSRPGIANAVGIEFNPDALGEWMHERLAGWSATLPKGHAYTHVFRKTSLQYAWRGEDVDRKVAKDAGVSQAVMMKHYVEVKDPELREASNRTYERIMASLPEQVVRQYGHTPSHGNGLEQQLEEAVMCKDWSRVADLSAQLAQARSRPEEEEER